MVFFTGSSSFQLSAPLSSRAPSSVAPAKSRKSALGNWTVSLSQLPVAPWTSVVSLRPSATVLTVAAAPIKRPAHLATETVTVIPIASGVWFAGQITASRLQNGISGTQGMTVVRLHKINKRKYSQSLGRLELVFLCVLII